MFPLMIIIYNDLLGSDFLPQNLNSESYERFEREEVFGLLVDIHLEARHNMLNRHMDVPHIIVSL